MASNEARHSDIRYILTQSRVEVTLQDVVSMYINMYRYVRKTASDQSRSTAQYDSIQLLLC